MLNSRQDTRPDRKFVRRRDVDRRRGVREEVISPSLSTAGRKCMPTPAISLKRRRALARVCVLSLHFSNSVQVFSRRCGEDDYKSAGTRSVTAAHPRCSAYHELRQRDANDICLEVRIAIQQRRPAGRPSPRRGDKFGNMDSGTKRARRRRDPQRWQFPRPVNPLHGRVHRRPRTRRAPPPPPPRALVADVS
ncbi:hypothetical protein EVAR_457_1 [Eumeta japonica]|uniref:Uncharacterized protein n=1 Tax=Eumeta variegata TaxID=151549 RepID=A0A4C1SBB4_EUMVA|nr:hypothetical protein EVAR_457_1 [Eumeta japonica]